MITIKPATATENWDAVAQLYFNTWQVAYRELLPQSFLQQLTPATWQPQKRWQHTILAWSNAQIIGIVTAGPARDEHFATFGELYSLYVLPNFQHRGIGTQLLHAGLHLIDHFPQQYLGVLVNNLPAQQLYASVGFVDSQQRQRVQTPQGHFTEAIWTRENIF
ncbi:GNAT family N-acetyltransferase [Lacticaseibacillus porcinae]|uniref:GNAT family N-acetyltransferase n=1 Tax=Lacticaseibacillus porcinae TaxID=1123687 RepID=UPI000F78FFE8|nr:GNAT family N-acetyltransferase [Lacticaseibacillus porcinae]